MSQKSPGTFSAGLPDRGVVFESQLERPERADIRWILGHQPVHAVPIGSQTLVPHQEGLSGTFPSISGMSDSRSFTCTNEGDPI